MARDDYQRAAELAAAGKIPLATALTDLVTKSAQFNIQSNLSSATITTGPLAHSSILASDTDTQPATPAATPNATPTPAPTAAATPAPPLPGLRSDRQAGDQSAGVPPIIRPNPRTEYVTNPAVLPSAVVNQAIERGYTPRNIEFDPRFQANVERVARPTSTTPSETRLDNERVWQGLAIGTAADDPFKDSVAVTGNNGLCSGTLISQDAVITASHCFCDGIRSEVLIGQNILSPIERISVDEANSAAMINCETFKQNRETAIATGDVAILKLKRPASATPRNIGGIAIVRDAAAARAVGFGRTDTNVVGFKYQVNLVIASPQCDGTALTGIPDRQIYRCQPQHELVAAGLNRDTCAGDSGGPLYVFGPDTRTYLVGVTSRAVHPQGRCGAGGIYVLLAATPVKEWLASRGIAVP
ncbi:trypsin-like serine protease [Bradyrhizobium yuanmingense]|uniref:trypsin-like serine protease n=1 Tax=Bradyrhizobium yuanmingense TaxID=108015 RepID=UPI003D2F47D4